MDLRRKVQRPERKKIGPVLHVDRQCHIGCTYTDYAEYISLNPDSMISQMDSVVIHKGGQCILIILLTSCDLQLMFPRERNTAASVTEVFRELWNKLGEKYFKELFQVILTDRGRHGNRRNPMPCILL